MTSNQAAKRANPAEINRTRIATALEQIAAAIDAVLAVNPDGTAVLEQPELLTVGDLTVEHYGRWVELLGNPWPSAAPDYHPSALAQGGRLVGIRAGDPYPPAENGQKRPPAYRVLVIQQANSAAPIQLTVDARVRVAPRAWS